MAGIAHENDPQLCHTLVTPSSSLGTSDLLKLFDLKDALRLYVQALQRPHNPDNPRLCACVQPQPCTRQTQILSLQQSHSRQSGTPERDDCMLEIKAINV